jgi:hypothetical protein
MYRGICRQSNTSLYDILYILIYALKNADDRDEVSRFALRAALVLYLLFLGAAEKLLFAQTAAPSTANTQNTLTNDGGGSFFC